MTKRKYKRGASPGTSNRRRSSGVSRKSKPSILNRIIRALPISEKRLQRVVTLALVGGVAVGGFAVAEASGVFVYAESQISHLASENGYRVRHLVVDGMDNIDETEVYSIIADQKDRSMPSVDVDMVRDQLLQLNWIADARVIRRLPDTLIVEVEERVATAIWEDDARYALIDSTGHVLEMVDAEARPDLPRINGEGANRKVRHLAELLDAAPAMKGQVAGAQWVGNRRWNLTFRTGETLQLPEGETTAEDALLTFARFDGVNRLLGRDLINFDMRDPHNLYVRKAAVEPDVPAAEEQEI